MTNLKLLLGGVIGALSLAASANAGTTLIVNTGWIDDVVSGPNTPSTNSVITFTVPTGDTYDFSLSDGYVAGDVYSATYKAGPFTITQDSAFAVLPTNFPLGLGDTTFDSAWTDSSYSHLQAAFGAGTYKVTIEDLSPVSDGFGYPAGFGYRLDAVPEPMTWSMMLVGFGGLGLALRKSRQKRVAATA